jgi:hypothetical protein
VLGADGLALIAFHTSDSENRTGESRRIHEWWGHDVTSRFTSCTRTESFSSCEAALQLIARLDRSPHARLKHEAPVPLVDDQEPVETFAAERADPQFGVGVGSRRPHRRPWPATESSR